MNYIIKQLVTRLLSTREKVSSLRSYHSKTKWHLPAGYVLLMLFLTSGVGIPIQAQSPTNNGLMTRVASPVTPIVKTAALTGGISPSNPIVGVTNVFFAGTATPGAMVTDNETAPDGTKSTFTYTANSSGNYSAGPYKVEQLGTYTEVLRDSISGATITVTYSGQGDFSASVNSTSQTVTRGQAASYTVTFNSLNGFTGKINPAALNWSPQIPGVTASWSQTQVTVPSNGSVPATFTIQTSANTSPGTYNNIVLQGTNGSFQRVASQVSLTVKAPVNPKISISPSTGTLGVTTFTETYSGFTPNGTITETVIYPNGGPTPYTTKADANGNASSTFIPTSQVGTYSSRAVDDATGTPSNTITYTTTAAALTGGISPSNPVVGVTNVNFVGTATPGAIVTDNETAPDGTKSAFTYTANSSGNYTSPSYKVQQLGTYTEALRDSTTGVTKTVTYNGTGDFSTSVNATSQTATAGQSASYTVTFSSLGGFTGVITVAALNWSPQIPGATASWSANQVTVPSNNSVTVIFTVQTLSSTPIGTYSNIVLQGTNGSVSHATPVSLTVNSNLPDLTISAQLGTSYTAGQRVEVPVTVYRSGGAIPTAGVYMLARLYWSTNSSYDTGDTQLWESNGSTPDYPVTVLNTNGSKTVIPAIYIPSNATPGQTYYILAYVDPPSPTYPNGYYQESNKTNNISTYPVTIKSAGNTPFVSSTPASGPQITTNFVMTGSGFTPNGKIDQFMTSPGQSVEQKISPIIADGQGNFSSTFITKCSDNVGIYSLSMLDVSKNVRSNTITQTITPSTGCNNPTISSSPPSGPQMTTTFTITGSGFTPGGSVRQLMVHPDGVTRDASGTTANSQGQITKSFTSDCATTVGPYTIWMIDVATGKESTRVQQTVTASSSCPTTPTLQVSQPSGPLGTTFRYTGAGYTRNSTATLNITRPDGKPGNGGKYNTDSNGNVTFVITSQSTDPTGLWTLQLTDDFLKQPAPPVSVQYSKTDTPQNGTDVLYYSDSSIDVTIPDNTQFAPGDNRYKKIWRIQNAGTNPWNNYRLVFVPGTVNGHLSENLSGTNSIAINSVAPGQWRNTPELAITAPIALGTHYSYWQMQNSSGGSFGTPIYVKIRVVSPQNATMSFGGRTSNFGTGDSPSSKSGYNADPVNTATGNYNYETTDLHVSGRSLDVEFGRAYNSQDTTPGPLGTGWSHSFNIYLTNINDATPSVHYSNGKALAYINQYGTNTYLSAYPGYYDQLIKNSDGTWTLKKTDQRFYQFNANGKLTAIQDRNGNQINLSYTAGILSQITDTVGRSFTLAYSGSLITSITDTQQGRTLQFGYDAFSNQTSFRDANNNQSSYFYDTSNRLTKIVDGRGNNLLVNTYDGNNRVATQTNGRGNLWSFVYNTDGSTLVYDPNNPVSNGV